MMNALGDLSRYRCQFLFLLIGTNPLPNYVAAKLLAVPSGMIYLVHTAEVASVKERLHERLTADGFTCHPLEVHEANAADIAGKIEDKVKGLAEGRVGLNYTGGTKAMAVHAYRAIERALSRRHSSPIFTYLDARRLELWVDPHNSATSQSFQVGLAVQVSLKDLCALHGNPLKSDPTTKPILAKMATTLAREHAEESFVKAWRQWCTEQLHRPDRPEKLKSKSQLKEVCLPEGDPLRRITETFRAEFSLTSASVTLEEAAQAAGIEHCDHLAKWLDGKWLEHDTIAAFQQVADQCEVHNYGMNLEPLGEPQFEFDVAAMRGYQLFAISCTTELGVGRCKLKLFEAYVRARQLGGDEARVGLVCCYDNPDHLRHQVERAWDAQGKVRVFGRADLPTLPASLVDWFNTAAG